MLLRGEGPQSLSPNSNGLGESPEAGFEQFDYQLQPGEALVISTDNFRDAADGRGQPLGQPGLAEALQGGLDLSAAELLGASPNGPRRPYRPPDWRPLDPGD